MQSLEQNAKKASKGTKETLSTILGFNCVKCRLEKQISRKILMF